MKSIAIIAIAVSICASPAKAEHAAHAANKARLNEHPLKESAHRPTPKQSTKQQPQNDLAAAKKLLADGELRRGIRLARKTLRFEQDNAGWHALYARFRLHSGAADERTEYSAKQALRLKPGDTEMICLYAMTKLLEQEFTVARDLAKAALKLNPNDVTAKVISKVAQSNIELPPSKNLAGPVLKPDDDDTMDGDSEPNIIERKRSVGVVLRGAGSNAVVPKRLPGESSSLATNAASKPSSKTILEVSKDSDSLIKIIETAGTAHDAYLVAAAHFRMHMNKARLLQVLNAWVKNNPKAAYAYYMRGTFEEEFNRLDRATADFQKALQLNPLCVLAMNRYANVLLKQKKYQESVETYDMVEQLNGMYPASYGRRADALLALRDYQNAALDYGRAVRAYIGETEASKQIAAAKEMSKTRQGHVRLLWARKVETLNKAKKYQRAADEARLLLMFSPGYTRAMDARQTSYQALGQYELALKDLNGMISLSPRVAPWYKARMEVLTKLGRTQEAAADKKRLENVLSKGVPE